MVLIVTWSEPRNAYMVKLMKQINVECGIIAQKNKDMNLHPTIETFLAHLTSLHQLEPKNLPSDVLHVMVKMSPEELFKTCTQLCVLLNNVPSQTTPITLSETEIATLAEEYLKGILKRFRG